MPGRAKPGQPKSQSKQTVSKRIGNGAGKGAGWGGPAKGAGTRFVKGQVQEGQGKGGTAPYVEKREERLAQLKDHLYTLAINAQREETQLAATVAFLNREEGMPVARQLTATTDEARLLRIEIVDEPDNASHGSEAAASPAGFQH
jgi:hypothetical protein